MSKTYKVNFMWDSEAYVWVASSKDVPGFYLEHGSFDALCEKVRIALPDFLDEKDNDISLEYSVTRVDRLVANG
ncbi:MAG: DUF1902 domain-containing protein [Defluviitaleaceae bacterium]|nr:DUF1902 domain-containing protein [Defluviitaleaceae bacterium]